MGPENRRILIATAVSVAILVGWQLLFPPHRAPHGPVLHGGGDAAAPAAGSAAAALPGAAPSPAAPAPAPGAPEQLVSLQGNGFRAVLSSHGGALVHLVLDGKKFQREVDGRTEQIDLVQVAPGEPFPLALTGSAQLGGAGDPITDPAARAPMTVVAQDATSVAFEGRLGAATVRKTIRLTGRPFELAVEVSIAGAPAGATASLLYPGFLPPAAAKHGFFSGPAVDLMIPVCRAGDRTERFKVDGDDAEKQFDGPAGWAGLDRHFFVEALFPAVPGGRCLFRKGTERGAAAALLQWPIDPSGAAARFTLFAGPKELDTLRGYGRSFETAIDYGVVTNFFAFFAQILLRVMRWFHGFAGNWGVAIILLTVSVKLLLYPLTLKSMKSMNEMRKLQPEIEKLKERFGADKEKLNLAVMQLYQQHKVNPLGGCLPMVLQMPIWFALYASLQTSVELYREPFLWMRDLTQHDPYFILPLAMGITSFVMQRLSPQPADSSQAKMMLYFFPGFFTIIMLMVPSGLTLYIFVNNLLSIVQQQAVNRMGGRVARA